MQFSDEGNTNYRIQNSLDKRSTTWWGSNKMFHRRETGPIITDPVIPIERDGVCV